MASDFDRDDLFGDFDENGTDDFEDFDDFDSDSELSLDDNSSLDDFGFDDDLGLDDDSLSFEEDFDDFDDFDSPSSSSDGEGGGRPSPIFIALAVVFIVILLGGLALILWLAVIQPASPAELTSTAIVATNEQVALLEAQTATQSKINLDLTMTAESFTDTPSPTPTATDTPTPTQDTSLTLTAEFEGTRQAADALALQTSVAATKNMEGTLNPPEVVSATPILPTAIGAVTDVPAQLGQRRPCRPQDKRLILAQSK
ncbi:MAG: hypothetical protein Q9P01_04150 [Anaerolineae bacterium]|nr:hypothetical protein [Anaerolineae bacterium]